MTAPAAWRTRFAPAPTGYLHLGHAVSALYVWGLARAFGGEVVLRVEDHDRIRSRPEYEAALLEDLDWLGLVPDEGTTVEFRAGPLRLRQSDNADRYAAALERLEAAGLVYPCTCSRKEIQAALEARGLTGEREELLYPGTCRERGIDPRETSIRRLLLPRREVVFEDLAMGRVRQVPAEQCGDLLLRDREGHWSYQFAVTVDDFEQGIDVVVRGVDLLASTGRQVQLAELLARTSHRASSREGEGARGCKAQGESTPQAYCKYVEDGDRPATQQTRAPVFNSTPAHSQQRTGEKSGLGRRRPPLYFHHPLVLREDGEKLSKSAGDTGVRELRRAGWSPGRVLGEAAARAGLLEAREGGDGPLLAVDDLADLFRDRHAAAGERLRALAGIGGGEEDPPAAGAPGRAEGGVSGDGR